jgi:hypothetical protein
MVLNEDVFLSAVKGALPYGRLVIAFATATH